MDLSTFISEYQTLYNEVLEDDAKQTKTLATVEIFHSENVKLKEEILNLHESLDVAEQSKMILEEINIDSIKLKQSRRKWKETLGKHEEVIKCLTKRLEREISKRDSAYGSKKKMENYLVRRLFGFHLDVAARPNLTGIFTCIPLSTGHTFSLANSSDTCASRAALLELASKNSCTHWQELFIEKSSPAFTTL